MSYDPHLLVQQACALTSASPMDAERYDQAVRAAARLLLVLGVNAPAALPAGSVQIGAGGGRGRVPTMPLPVVQVPVYDRGRVAGRVPAPRGPAAP